MATEREIEAHKNALLDAVGKQNWECADTEMAWLSRNLPENQSDEFYPSLLMTLNQMIESDCKIPIPLTIRGYIKSNLGEYIGAIADFDASLELNHYHANTYSYRGTAKAFRGDHLGAISDFDMAIRLNLNDADIYSNRGTAKSYIEDYQGALNDYEQAIRIQPDNSLYYYLKGLVFLKIDEEQRAEKSFDMFFDKKYEFDNEQDKENMNKSKRGKKSNKVQLYRLLNDISDEFYFLKDKNNRDRIDGRIPHENILYLYALLDHAIRNTLCYIAVVNLKCNFESTKKHLASFRPIIANFKNDLSNASINIEKYPDNQHQTTRNLIFATRLRSRLAHGKKIGKSSDETKKSKNRWEAISDVTDAQCYKACIYFIKFFIEYLKFFDENIQKKGGVKFNPFNDNFQGFIRKGNMNESQTEVMLRGMGIISSKSLSKNKNSK